MQGLFRLSRRQTVALVLLLGVGLILAWVRVAAVAPTAPEPPVWTARVSFMQVNHAALVAAPGLSPADVRLRLRQVAADSTAPWVVYRRQVAWTPAREAVIARYVDLPNSVPAEAADLGPVDKRRKRTRRYRLWP